AIGPEVAPEGASVSSDRRALAIIALANRWSSAADRDDRRITGQVSPPCWVNLVRSGNPSGENPPEWMAFVPNNAMRMALGINPGPERSSGRSGCGPIARCGGNSRDQIPRILHPRSIPGNARSPYHLLLLVGDVANTALASRACVLSTRGEP